MTGWLPRDEQPDPIDFRPIEAYNKHENGHDQDVAAGSRKGRTLVRADGSEVLAVVRVRLRQDLQSRRGYATLRWFRVAGDPSEHWIGRVDARNRTKALAEAWRIVHERDLLSPKGRQADRAARRRPPAERTKETPDT